MRDGWKRKKWKGRKRCLKEFGGKEEQGENNTVLPLSAPTVEVDWGTIGANPVFLLVRPVSFPKPVASFGIGDIHDFYHRNPLNVNGLVHT